MFSGLKLGVDAYFTRSIRKVLQLDTVSNELMIFSLSICLCSVQDGQSRTIRQFHFTDWPEQGVPKSGEGFIDFIGQVHKTKEQFGQDGPITVHCRLLYELVHSAVYSESQSVK